MLFDDVPVCPTITLYNLSLSLQSCVKSNFPGSVWVEAEISSLNVNPSSGHCYLELVDVDPATHQQRAKMRATIWARRRVGLFQTFRLAAGVDLRAGLGVRVLASIDFSPAYGLSLNITGIDGAYTAGALALKRQQTLAQLARDGVLEMNRAMPRPALPRRIAVVSSSSAAGYEDFMNQIEPTKRRFSLNIRLFEAIMQGDQAPSSIVDALGKIFQTLDQWDAVIIIRGGGAKLDLSCFDDYTLASHVAQFPLPIYAGIGHERDSSVVDIVANASVKTPTAAAEFIRSFFLEREQAFKDTLLLLAQGLRAAVDGSRLSLGLLSGSLCEGATRQLRVRRVEVDSFSRQIVAGLANILRIKRGDLVSLCGTLSVGLRAELGKRHSEVMSAAQVASLGATRRLGECREALGEMAAHLAGLRPASILAKGYARVELVDGRAVIRAADATPGGDVVLRWADGSRRAKIE